MNKSGSTSEAVSKFQIVEQKPAKSVYNESMAYALYKTLCSPRMRPVTIRCIVSILHNFFFRQYRAALLPGRVPVSGVDHQLDEKIPFTPSWVTVYLDFSPFWIRVVSFLLRNYGRKAHNTAIDFISSMGKLYEFAACVYQKNFSTTRRPFYIARPRFFLIHLVDPHLMCIPSLHVMIAIRTYTKFAQIMRDFGDDTALAPQIEELRQGALAISRAVLYVKQHSINCISAALYAMTCFEPALFTPEQAEAFAVEMFSGERPAAVAFNKRLPNYAVRPTAAPPSTITANNAGELQEYAISLFRRFLSEKENAKNWEEPLLNFLRK